MVAIVEEPMLESTWREKYWPIEDHELKKVVPMISMSKRRLIGPIHSSSIADE